MKKGWFITSMVLIAVMALTSCSGGQASPTAEPAAAATAAPTIAENAAPTSEPTAAPAAAGEQKIVFGMVTDQNGLGDQGFNDTTWAGIQKAAKDLGGEAKILESSEQAQYVPNLTSLAQEKATLVIGVGSLLTDAMAEVSKQFPKQNFALVDSTVDVPNVRSLVFREQEASYLGGIMAGLTTKSNVIGVLGGMEVPPVVRWISGFQAGVKTVNPKASVLVTYAGSFGDPAKGKEIALSFMDQKADIVFEVSGGTGIGAFQAVSEKGPGYFIMGTDTCKNKLAPNNSLPDIVKRLDNAVYQTAQDVVAGKFTAGIFSLGLKEDAMGLCDQTYSTLPENIRTTIEKAKKQIVDGTIVPPTDKASLDAFAAPDLSK